MEGHQDAIWGEEVKDFPNVDDAVSLSPTLKGVEAEFFQSLPVVQFGNLPYLCSYRSLDRLDGHDILFIKGDPKRTGVFQPRAYKTTVQWQDDFP